MVLKIISSDYVKSVYKMNALSPILGRRLTQVPLDVPAEISR